MDPSSESQPNVDTASSEDSDSSSTHWGDSVTPRIISATPAPVSTQYCHEGVDAGRPVNEASGSCASSFPITRQATRAYLLRPFALTFVLLGPAWVELRRDSIRARSSSEYRVARGPDGALGMLRFALPHFSGFRLARWVERIEVSALAARYSYHRANY